MVGKTSPWIDADSASAPSRRDGEAALRQELMWAAHLSLHAVLLPTPSFSAANYARVVNQFLSALSSTALWVRVPVVAPEADRRRRRAATTKRRRATTLRDPVRGVGQLPGAVRGPPAARRVPGRGRGVAHGRGDRPVGGRTRARGGHRAERVRRQQARLPGVAQAPPGVRLADDAQGVQVVVTGTPRGTARTKGGHLGECRCRGRAHGGRAVRRRGRGAHASQAAGWRQRAAARPNRGAEALGVRGVPVPQDRAHHRAGAARGGLPRLPAGAAAASDGQPGVRDVRDVREGRLEVHPVRRGCAGVPRRPRVGRRRRGRAGHRAGGGWRRSRASGARVAARVRAERARGARVRGGEEPQRRDHAPVAGGV